MLRLGAFEGWECEFLCLNDAVEHMGSSIRVYVDHAEALGVCWRTIFFCDEKGASDRMESPCKRFDDHIEA